MSARLRITFVVESGTDVRLVDGLAQRYDVTVLARRIVGGVEISRPPSNDVRVIVGPSGRMQFAAFTLRYLLRHPAATDRVLVQGYGAAALAANSASGITGKPTCMLVCSPAEAYYRCRKEADDTEKPFRWRELAAVEFLARCNALAGQRYVVLSQFLANVVRDHGGGPDVRVVPVYGVDTDLFRPANRDANELRAQLDLPRDGKLLFFSSRLAPEKDADTLLRAMRALVDQGRDVHLLHLSGGYRTFEEHAAAFGLDDRIVARDAVHPRDGLPSYYQSVDLCIQASRAEGLGFSPLEALACEVPVVASEVGGLLETIVPGETGWTYPVGDAPALAHCIADALDNPAEAHRRAVAGRKMVADGFNRGLVFANLDTALRSA